MDPHRPHADEQHEPTPSPHAAYSRPGVVVRYGFGLSLLVFVVCLWVGSSALIQSIFTDLNFHQPFLLTFYSTALFTLYIPIVVLRRLCAGEGRSDTGHHRPLSQLEEEAQRTSMTPSTHTTPAHDTRDIRSESHDSITPLQIDVQPSEVDSAPTSASPMRMSVRDTAHLSLLLCPLWFSMNYLFNVSLGLTSIASCTILSTTSSLFVLIFSRIFDPNTHIRMQQVIGVAVTIIGVATISYKDTSSHTEEDGEEHALVNRLIGDLFATVAAVVYGGYTVLLKIRIPDENCIDMQLLFGFIGLFNILLMWPGFLILSLTGVEEFITPPASVIGMLTLNGIFGTVISDYLWARSVLLTSPLIASIGLALTIPLAILVDWAIHDLQFTFLYFIGSAAVLIGFILVNVVHSHALQSGDAASYTRGLTTEPVDHCDPDNIDPDTPDLTRDMQQIERAAHNEDEPSSSEEREQLHYDDDADANDGPHSLEIE